MIAIHCRIIAGITFAMKSLEPLILFLKISIMHKYSCIIIFLLFSTYVFAERHKLQVWDKESGISVPYTEISTESGVVAICDENGIVSLEIEENTLYTFSQIGYDSITIDGKRLLRLKRVQLKEQPLHLNEAVVIADIALYDLKRAMDSTSKLIPKTQYMKNYSLHRVECNGELVLEIKAITVARVVKRSLYSTNSGTILVVSEKNGDGDSSTLPADIVEKSNVNKIFFYNNTFMFDTKKDRESFYFTYLNRLDSNTVISYYPKYEDRFGQGRFLLNTENWTIRKFSYYLPENQINSYIEYQRNVKKNQLLNNFAQGYFEYNEFGNTTSLVEQFSFISSDEDDIKWSLFKTFSYEIISKAEYDEYYKKNRDTYPRFRPQSQSVYDLQNINTHIILENSEKFKITIEE